MGETENPHFYAFGIFEPVTKPQNQLFFWDTRTPNTSQGEIPKLFYEI